MAYLPKDESVQAIEEAVWCLYKTGMSYKEIAGSIGVHQRTLYKWLSGERAAPLAVCLALAYVLLVRERQIASVDCQGTA